jgi:hypothetical protein
MKGDVSLKLKLAIFVFVIFVSLTGCISDKKEVDVSLGLKAGESQSAATQDKPFDEKVAVTLVLKDHLDFPKAGEVKKIETRTGGPAPGLKVDGELKTTVEKSTERDSYIVTLTKAWNQKVNDKEAKSVWTYKVTPDKVELISSEENADSINLIR